MIYRYCKDIRDERGKRIKIRANTPEELEARIAARQAIINRRLDLAGNPTVSVYALTWMRMQPSSLSRSRLSDYDLSLRLHILPHIGDLHLTEVSAADIAALMRAEDKLSRSMQQKLVYVLRGLFDLAAAEGLCTTNPCAALRAGGKTQRQKDGLTRAQRAVLEDALCDTRVYPFVMLALYAGLRREEILGLKWDCIHLDGDAPYIAVKRSLVWDKCRPIVRDELKTDAAERNIPIPSKLLAALRAEQANSTSEHVVAMTDGSPMTDSGWRALWSLVERRQPEDIRPRKRRSRATERDADGHKANRRGYHASCPHTINFVVTPHMLRRTYATELILGGCDVKTAQYLLGHTKAETTLNWYAKIMDNRPEDTIGKVRAAFGDGPESVAKGVAAAPPDAPKTATHVAENVADCT